MQNANNVPLDTMWDFYFCRKSLAEIDVTEITFNDIAAVPGCFDTGHPYFLQRGTGCYRTFVEVGGEIELYSEGLGLRADIYWDKKKVAEIDAPFSKNTFRFDAGSEGRHELIFAVNNQFDDGKASL